MRITGVERAFFQLVFTIATTSHSNFLLNSYSTLFTVSVVYGCVVYLLCYYFINGFYDCTVFDLRPKKNKQTKACFFRRVFIFSNFS